MKQVCAAVAAMAVGVSMAGCARITTQVVEKPRVDQQLEQGNKGYLSGKAPAAGPRKTTRKMFQADVEMATKEELTPWKKSQPKPAGAQAAPAPAPKKSGYWEEPVTKPAAPQQQQSSWDEEEVPVAAPARVAAPSAPSSTTYTVKQGDTLEKIAASVYGDGSKWRRIYEANSGTLKSPNKIYPGQKLMIPAIASEKKSGSSSRDMIK